MHSRSAWLVALSGAVFVAALTLPRLGSRSFWNDEISSVLFARSPWPDFAASVAGHDINMSLYYLVLRGWLLLGESELQVRLLSVIFAAAVPWAVFDVASRIGGRRVGVVSTALIATNAFFIEYAQEARGYSLLVLTVCIATGAFLRLAERPGLGRWFAYVLVSVVAAYTHMFALLVIGAHGLAVLIARRNLLVRPALPAAWIAIAAASVPLLIAVRSHQDVLGWLEPPSPRSVYYALHSLIGSGGELLLAAHVVVWLLAAWRFVASLRSKRAAQTFLEAVGWCWMLFPIAAAFIVSQVSPAFCDRYLIVTLPALAIVAALGVTAWRKVVGSAAMAAVLIGISVVGLASSQSRLPIQDWPGLTEFVLARTSRADTLVFFAPGTKANFLYYAGRLHPGLAVPDVAYPREDDGTLAANIGRGSPPPDLLDRLRPAPGSVWLILGHDWSAAARPISDALRTALEQEFGPGEEQHFEGRLRAIRFARDAARDDMPK